MMMINLLLFMDLFICSIWFHPCRSERDILKARRGGGTQELMVGLKGEEAPTGWRRARDGSEQRPPPAPVPPKKCCPCCHAAMQYFLPLKKCTFLREIEANE